MNHTIPGFNIFGLLFPVLMLFTNFTVAQSPFNYGQHEEIYFLSAQERMGWGLSDMYVAEEYAKGETGGMNENWSLSVISLEENEINDDWHPAYLNNTYIYELETLMDSSRFLNGSTYQFEDGRLTSFGGTGYGSLEVMDIRPLSNRVSLSERRCSGNCGDFSLTYSKLVSNERGLLTYRVSYNKEVREDGEVFEGDGEAEFDAYLKTLFPEGIDSDTLYVHYDSNGLFLAQNSTRNWQPPAEFNSPFVSSKTADLGKELYQCYIGMEDMESYLLNKLGYLPRIFLIDINGAGVFSFFLNEKENKYQRNKTVILKR